MALWRLNENEPIIQSPTQLRFRLNDHGISPQRQALDVSGHTGATVQLYMRKVIAAINMTIDGVCDHTAGLPDEGIHQHYADLLDSADIILYGRITYQLMQYWQTLIKNPSGDKTTDGFALAIDKIQKIVLSHKLNNTDWDSAKLSTKPIEELVKELKQQSGKDILVGSRSLITQLMKLNLIDEYQLCVHPVIAGNGLPLFENVNDRSIFKLTKTKIFNNGAITLYYEPIK